MGFLVIIVVFAVMLLMPLLIAAFVVGMTPSPASRLLRARIHAVFLGSLLMLIGLLAGMYGVLQLATGTVTVGFKNSVSYGLTEQPMAFSVVALIYLLLVLVCLYLAVQVYRLVSDPGKAF